jgi:hypothetical protein
VTPRWECAQFLLSLTQAAAASDQKGKGSGKATEGSAKARKGKPHAIGSRDVDAARHQSDDGAQAMRPAKKAKTARMTEKQKKELGLETSAADSTPQDDSQPVNSQPFDSEPMDPQPADSQPMDSQLSQASTASARKARPFNPYGRDNPDAFVKGAWHQEPYDARPMETLDDYVPVCRLKGVGRQWCHTVLCPHLSLLGVNSGVVGWDMQCSCGGHAAAVVV